MSNGECMFLILPKFVFLQNNILGHSNKRTIKTIVIDGNSGSSGFDVVDRVAAVAGDGVEVGV